MQPERGRAKGCKEELSGESVDSMQIPENSMQNASEFQLHVQTGSNEALFEPPLKHPPEGPLRSLPLDLRGMGLRSWRSLGKSMRKG